MQIGHTSISISIFPSDRLSKGRERRGWKEGGRGTRSMHRSSNDALIYSFSDDFIGYIVFFLFFLFFLVGEIEDWDLFYRSRRNCINYIG